MHLQHHGSQKDAKNILFYALWVLYALSAGTSIIHIITIYWRNAVSMDVHGCLTFLQLIVQNVEILYLREIIRLEIIQVTVFACCDFIAQFILVSTAGNAYHLPSSCSSSKIYRCWIMWGLQYSCRDRSLEKRMAE